MHWRDVSRRANTTTIEICKKHVPRKSISLSLILVTHTYHLNHTIAPRRRPNYHVIHNAARLCISGRFQPKNHSNSLLKSAISFLQRFKILERYPWIHFDTSRRCRNLIILHEVDLHHDSWLIPARSKREEETHGENQITLSPMGQSWEIPEH